MRSLKWVHFNKRVVAIVPAVAMRIARRVVIFHSAIVSSALVREPHLEPGLWALTISGRK